MNWRALLSSLDPTEAVTHSMLNHHAIGFHYLNLFRSDRLTIKLYIAPETPHAAASHNYSGALVNPHDHRFGFSNEVLVGQITDESYITHRPTDSNQWIRYKSPAFQEPIEVIGLTLSDVETLNAGSRIEHDASEIHTIAVHTPCVILQTQYHDVRETSNLYVPSGSTASFAGLYVRPTTDDIRNLTAKVYEMMARNDVSEP